MKQLYKAWTMLQFMSVIFFSNQTLFSSRTTEGANIFDVVNCQAHFLDKGITIRLSQNQQESQNIMVQRIYLV